MKVITRTNETALLRFDRGEDVLKLLRDFCATEEIYAAAFTALGAAERVELAYYNLGTKEYMSQTFADTLEIAGMTGNVAQAGGEVVIHAHGVFSDRAMRPVAGHINVLIAAGTCELTLTVLPGKMGREYDEATGLKLLK